MAPLGRGGEPEGRLALDAEAVLVNESAARDASLDLLVGISSCRIAERVRHLRLMGTAGAQCHENRDADATELRRRTRADHAARTVLVLAFDELFASAMRSVVVCCYAISQGDKVFAKLAANLDANPALNVRIFTNSSTTLASPRGCGHSLMRSSSGGSCPSCPMFASELFELLERVRNAHTWRQLLELLTARATCTPSGRMLI